MSDLNQAILNSLDRIATDLEKPVLKYITPLPTVTYTLASGTTPVSIAVAFGAATPSIAVNSTSLYVQSIIIKLQNLGTAAYVVVGTAMGQQIRLNTIDSYYRLEAPPGFCLNPMDIWVAASTGTTSVVEVATVVYDTATVSSPVTPRTR